MTSTSDFAADIAGTALGRDAASYRRRLVLLLFDLSGSMGVPTHGRRPVDELNDRVADWVVRVRDAADGQLGSVEFAVLTFSGRGVQVHRGTHAHEVEPAGALDPLLTSDRGAFMPAADLQVGPFAAYGLTPLVPALETGLKLIDGRREHLRRRGVDTRHAQLFLFTDGRPYDLRTSPHAWNRVVDDVERRRIDGSLRVVAFGTPGCDTDRLRRLAGADGLHRLEGMDFARLLELVLVASSARDPYHDLRSMFSEGLTP